MSITIKVAATVDAVASGSGNEFVTTGPFVLYGDNFSKHERARLLRLGPSATFIPATNNNDQLFVSGNPNMVYVDAMGTYRIEKDATVNAASVGYEEQ